MKSVKKLSRTIFYVFIALVLLALIGGIVYLTRGGKDNIKTFSMRVGDKYILRDEHNVTIASGEKITVNSSTDYSVAVYAYTEYDDFELIVDGESKHWSDYAETDFLSIENGGLTIEKRSGEFLLFYQDFKSILGKDKTVEIVGKTASDILRLEVVSNDSTINVSFSLTFDYTITVSPDTIKH